jgi:hypothetical protein
VKGIVVRVKNAEVVFPRPGLALTLRLEAGRPAEGTLEVDPPTVAEQLREALALLADLEMYDTAVSLRREMTRLGFDDASEDSCEGKGG